MSGEGPESIPTSADPRSRRPVKKRALTPVSAQASHVDALFARPDQEIRIPPSSTSSDGTVGSRVASLRAPPEIVTNVQGSSAGAGSGEFHVYKAGRRREYERLKLMDEETRREREEESFRRDKEDKARRDDEKTRRNRERRDKMKARKARGKAGSGGSGGDGDNAAARGATAGGGGGGPTKGPRVLVTRPDDDGKADEDAELKDAPTTEEPKGILIEED